MAGVLLKVFATVFLVVFALCGKEASGQTHHVVGGDDGWSSTLNISSWLSGRVFRVGDKVWFTNTAAGESIVELQSLKEFVSCDLTNPIKMYTDGVNDITLEEEGTRYFTSGNLENCKKGMKLPVPVQPSSAFEPAPPTPPQPLPTLPPPSFVPPPSLPVPVPVPVQPPSAFEPAPPTPPQPLPTLPPPSFVPPPSLPVPVLPPPPTPPTPPSAATSLNVISIVFFAGLALSYFGL